MRQAGRQPGSQAARHTGRHTRRQAGPGRQAGSEGGKHHTGVPESPNTGSNESAQQHSQGASGRTKTKVLRKYPSSSKSKHEKKKRVAKTGR